MLMVWPFSGLATLVIQYIKAEDRVFYYFSLCVTILKATGGHKPPSSLIFTLTLLKALGIGIHTQKSKKNLYFQQRNCLPFQSDIWKNYWKSAAAEMVIRTKSCRRVIRYV